ncbi:hypothetical protein Acy02nite_21130 [Actinoplanes cyaneus]|uniref:Uncharacterized protein n=1 Tax=Actinoplanes cyaneus TaxID=52696 RepID=A0A919IH28_9ACTN|nr:hypothetical protein Acy02nite_21130 [Actinoplanes cyaneus]
MSPELRTVTGTVTVEPGDTETESLPRFADARIPLSVGIDP